MSKLKIPIFLIFIFLLYFSLQIFLNYKNQIPFSTAEAEIYMLSKTSISATLESKKIALEFAQNNGYLFSLIPILYLIPFTVFSPSIYFFRIPQLIAGFILYVVLFILIKKFTNNYLKRETSFIILSLLIILSPWIQALILFHLPETLTLIFFILSFYLVLEIKSQKKIALWILLTISLTITSISSFSGFWLSLFMPIAFFIYLNEGLKKKYCIIFLLVIYSFFTILLYKNNNFVSSFIKEKSFIGQLTPSKLANEINERQKIDYLSSGKKFILPPLVRKFIYNKPFLAFDKVYKNIVSYFDFEQYAFPLISYDIVRLSGLLPKGNLPLGFFWDIPLICLGIFSILIKKNKIDTKFFFFILILFIPSFLMFKRDILTSGFALALLIILFQSTGFKQLVNSSKNRLKILSMPSILLISFLFISGAYEQNILIYKNIFSYQTSHLFFYKEISRFISENNNSDSKFIITNRFGPTPLMTSFYLNINPDTYWTAFKLSNNISFKIDNLEFRNINFPNEPVQEKNIFIGLPGEFTKPGNNPNQITLSTNLRLIDEIKAPDALVWQYGQNLWIISEKK